MAHRYGRFTSRTKARKRAADILFEADQKGLITNQSKLEALLEQRRDLTIAKSPLPDYSATLVSGVGKNLAQIDSMLATVAKGAGLDRVPAVDLAVMRVAVWEMLHNRHDVPPVTAIDEAVVLVKELSTDESPAYVNAVLDAIRKVLPPADESVGEQETSDPDDLLSDEELDELLGEY